MSVDSRKPDGIRPRCNGLLSRLRSGVMAAGLGLGLIALQGCSHLTPPPVQAWKAGDHLALEVGTEIQEPGLRWTRNSSRGEAFLNGGASWGAVGLIIGGLLVCPIVTFYEPIPAYDACATAFVETGFVLGGLANFRNGGGEGDNEAILARVTRMEQAPGPAQRLRTELWRRLSRHWTLTQIEPGPQLPPGASRVEVVLRGLTVHREDRDQIRFGLRADVHISLDASGRDKTLSFEHSSGFASMRAWQDAQDDYLETSFDNGLRQLAARIATVLLDEVNSARK